MATQLETDQGIVRVPTGTWTVDPSHSSVEFRIKHMMISTVRGHFGEFEGTIEAAPEYRDSKVHGTIQAASIDTNETRRDEHLRSADFFDVENHPTIEFDSTRVEHKDRGDYRVTGDLTMHGETHPVTLDVTVHGVTRDAQGHDASASRRAARSTAATSGSAGSRRSRRVGCLWRTRCGSPPTSPPSATSAPKPDRTESPPKVS